MRMVRRVYDEDSSVEDSEDYPLYRTPRLHGGSELDAPGPSGLQNADAESGGSAEEDNDEGFAGDESHEGAPLERHSSALDLRVDEYNFLSRLHYPNHEFEKEERRTFRHRCRICESDRLGPKVQCTQCGVFVHKACITARPDDLPVPCIHPTPMPGVGWQEGERPELKDLNYLPVEIPRVPAYLTKCLYELQTDRRITKYQLYVTYNPTPKQRLHVERLHRKLRRDVNRNLAPVPTEILSACLLVFLSEISQQLLVPEDVKVCIKCSDNKENLSEEALKAVMNAHVEKVMTEHHRVHTVAAMMLHLHTVLKHADKNKMTKEELIEIFNPEIWYIRVLFLVDPEVWQRKLDAPNEFVEPPPAAPRRWCA